MKIFKHGVKQFMQENIMKEQKREDGILSIKVILIKNSKLLEVVNMILMDKNIKNGLSHMIFSISIENINMAVVVRQLIMVYLNMERNKDNGISFLKIKKLVEVIMMKMDLNKVYGQNYMKIFGMNAKLSLQVHIKMESNLNNGIQNLEKIIQSNLELQEVENMMKME
ncbi:unnamed protein product [Paramecium sonneborni]|uniref:Uncharacterized protein n=1 Tax=Paramecium sonneborni TaxID=65129 RepID=A0A8S1PRA9_9CILI|nr:unnamed protein product [Paramecium sonneborni]